MLFLQKPHNKFSFNPLYITAVEKFLFVEKSIFWSFKKLLRTYSSLVNGISTVVGFLMPKQTMYKDKSGTI